MVGGSIVAKGRSAMKEAPKSINQSIWFACLLACPFSVVMRWEVGGGRWVLIVRRECPVSWDGRLALRFRHVALGFVALRVVSWRPLRGGVQLACRKGDAVLWSTAQLGLAWLDWGGPERGGWAGVVLGGLESVVLIEWDRVGGGVWRRDGMCEIQVRDGQDPEVQSLLGLLRFMLNMRWCWCSLVRTISHRAETRITLGFNLCIDSTDCSVAYCDKRSKSHEREVLMETRLIANIMSMVVYSSEAVERGRKAWSMVETKEDL